jgi:recombination protein RecA
MPKSLEKTDARSDSKSAAASTAVVPVMKSIPAPTPNDPARDSALNRAVQQIEKQFGKGAVMRLDGNAPAVIDGIPTGSLGLDIALGGYGIPRGRVIEIFGPESSGKTTLTLHIISNTQKAGGIAAFIDAEHALDPSWAKRLGVHLDDLLVSQPDTGEQALEIC